MGKVYIRMPQVLLNEILEDLRRPHKYAFERVGFCYGKSVEVANGEWLVIINKYQPVDEVNYIKTKDVGARINSEAIRSAFQLAYTDQSSLFHIHLHDFGGGLPGFSEDDMSSGPAIIESLRSLVKSQVHGMIVLNKESFNALALVPGTKCLIIAEQISSVGTKLNASFPNNDSAAPAQNERYSRQSFLGDKFQIAFNYVKIGVVGLSGGGSHIVQQLAHIGFKKYVLADPDIIDDESNLNRVVGATLDDAQNARSKFEVFKRLIYNLHPDAIIQGGIFRWEEIRNELKTCDIIFGCLDTVLGRRDLENFCRRYLINFIDIGMGVELSQLPFAMYGQVQSSVPGYPCLTCNGFITEDSLAREANNYGQRTIRPQVVWPNGILASTAIGIAVNMLCNWSGVYNNPEYLSYDGNKNSLTDHINRRFRESKCKHYPIMDAGPLVF